MASYIALVCLVLGAVSWFIVKMDTITRRGIFLGVVTLLLLALTVAIAQSSEHTIRNSAGSDNGLATVFGVVVIWFFLGAFGLVAVVTALVEAWLARHMRWLVGIALVTALAITWLPLLSWHPVTLLASIGASPSARDASFWGVILVPLAVVLAYAIVRTVRPIAPRPAVPAAALPPQP